MKMMHRGSEIIAANLVSGNWVRIMVLKTGPGKEPEKGVVPVSLVRP
jgi:hypothetical protein